MVEDSGMGWGSEGGRWQPALGPHAGMQEMEQGGGAEGLQGATGGQREGAQAGQGWQRSILSVCGHASVSSLRVSGRFHWDYH